MAVVAPLALVVAGLSSPATAAVTTGNVKGVVTLDGAPIDVAKVQLFRSVEPDPTDELRFTRIKTFNTSSSGRYSFSGLKLQRDPRDRFDIYQYRVVVTDRSGRGAKTYRVVNPRKGRTVTRNVTLHPAATITGTVARSDGGSPAELTVELGPSLGADEFENLNPELFADRTTQVAADGTFRFAGLSPTTYLNLAVSGGPYKTRCLDTTTNALADCYPPNDDPLLIRVAAGQTLTVPTLTASELKPPTSTLRGRITDTSGRPLKGIRTELQLLGGATKRTILTRSSGRFTVSGTDTGTYVVRVTDPKGRWKGQYLGGATAGSALPVVVTGGTDVSGLDVRLRSRASVRTSRAGGNGSATIAFDIVRAVTGSRPGGSVSLTSGDRSRTAKVEKGKAKVTLTGLPAGRQRITATYSGTSSTAGYTKTYSVTVR